MGDAADDLYLREIGATGFDPFEEDKTTEKLLDDAMKALCNFLLRDESVFTMNGKLKFSQEAVDAIQKWKRDRND